MGQQLHPEAPLLNMAFAFRLRGTLDADAFEAAFRSVVDRSDALRTVVEVYGGLPSQRETPEASGARSRVERVDLSAEVDPNAAYARWAQARVRRPFVLSEALVDASLVRLGPEEHVWLLNQHHLIADAWSTANVFRAVADAYDRIHAGTLDAAPSLPAFADYVDYEQRFRASPLFERAERHWAEQPPLAAPPRLYGMRETTPTTETVRVTRRLGAERSQRLRGLARGDGALTEHVGVFTRFATLLFAFLHRASGQNRLAFGAPAHNRPTAAFKETVGVFIETFPLQAEIEDGETFATLLAKVRREAGMFLRYAQPGASTAAGHRGLGALLNYVPATFGDFAGLPAETEWIHAGHGDPHHHVRLQVHDFDASGEITLALDLNAALFDADARETAADHLVALLDAMLDDETQPLATAPMLSEVERDRILTTFATTPEDDALAPEAVPESLLHGLWRQAEATPEAVALEDDTQTWTFSRLLDQVDGLARHLREQAVGVGTRVVIEMERSAEAVIAILATLRAGGAYVPLDPASPEARREALLQEIEPTVLLTDESVATALAHATTPEASGDGLPLPAGSDLAYILYTSGSTGRAKGVMVEHHALAEYASWAAEHYASGEPCDFALFTPLTFDLTITSLVVPLLTGGRIRVYPDPADGSPVVLRVVDEDAVDAIKLTPSHLALLRGHVRVKRIRQIILGGEALTTAHARLATAVFASGARIEDEYGPTEATVGCSVHLYDPATDSGDTVPIGRPAAHAEVYVLNEARRPVPVGVTGEIYVGGPGLARGYFRQPEKTAERFVPHPFRPSDRIYRTGDLGLWRADGTLEYLGRTDDQVKVNGVRVELGEVEAALAAVPGVTAAAAAVVASGAAPEAPDVFCVRCGLPSTYPGASFDDAGVCHLCTAFDGYKDRAEAYFESTDELRAIFDAARPTNASGYDCLMLLSGGKDSCYALGQLVEMGLRVLTFTLDNGYISEEAKANIRRVTDALGVDHVFGTTPAMNAIFVDSLERYSNVCQGCFKTIYTLALDEAKARGIPIIVTGLSRGQFFETRLTRELFETDDFTPERIDLTVLQARKAYHRVDDAVSRHLDVSALQDGTVLDEVRFVDFYRYHNPPLADMLAYLDEHLPWVRPSDTGRSTNCLINDAGIWVHKREQGYHNYALPYSWDVRMGHKTRDESLDELDDEIDERKVRRMLREIGYDGPALDELPASGHLVGYYVAPEAIPADRLRAALRERLPLAVIPAAFVHMDALPTTPNGKVNRAALPLPEDERPDLSTAYAAPHTEAERTLAAIWEDVLHLQRVGVDDNFFDLGGDSILAMQITSRAADAGLALSPGQLFAHQTVAELAEASGAGASRQRRMDLPEATGPIPLTPVQRWFLRHADPNPNHWNQARRVRATEPLDPDALQRALDAVAARHDALRLRLVRDASGAVHQTVVPEAEVPLATRTMPPLPLEEIGHALTTYEAGLHRSLDVENSPLLRVDHVRMESESGEWLLLVAHHLAVDGVSWPILLADLEAAYGHEAAGTAAPEAASGVTFAQWAAHLADPAVAARLHADVPRWNAALAHADATLGPPEAHAAGASGEARVHEVTLSAAETDALLRDAPARLDARPHEILLTALGVALRPWATGQRLRVDVETHGRDASDVDVSRTVGWFTALVPLALPLASSIASPEAREAWRALPEPGAGYGLLHALPARGGLDNHPDAEVLFNYLGDLDRTGASGAMLQPEGPITLSRDASQPLTHRLTVDAWVQNGCLHATWTHPPADADRVGDAARAFRDALIEAPAPKTAPLVDLSASALSTIADLLRQADARG